MSRSYEYDSASVRLQTLHQAGGPDMSFGYHPNGLLREMTTPNGGRRFAYDFGGRLRSVETQEDGRSPSLAYERDAAGRILGETTSSGSYHEADYDADGHLTRLDGVHYVLDAATARLERIEVRRFGE